MPAVVNSDTCWSTHTKKSKECEIKGFPERPLVATEQDDKIHEDG